MSLEPAVLKTPIHRKVGTTALAGSLVSLGLQVSKHYGYDLSDYEGQIIVVVGMLVGYMTRG